jgi:lysophospholipase L1-like esterase
MSVRLRIICMGALCTTLSSTVMVFFAGIAMACGGTGGGGCEVPTASTGSATAITSNSATLNGSVNAQGCITNYLFEWGTSASGSFPDSIEGYAGNETFPKAVSTNLPAGILQPNTDYKFRLSAINSEGKKATGSAVPFKTSAACAKPTVTTNTPASVTNTSALLSGSVNTNGCQTTTKIEWGPSSSPGTYPNSVNGPSGTGTLSPSYTVSGLQPNTGYHYRISASNSTTGTTPGTDKPFTTLKTKYVALGDSFSSGVGTGTYTPDPEECKRSMYSYPELLHNAHPDWSFVNATCEGATVSWLMYKEAKDLSQDVNWVTYTIGGNDADFPWVMFDCAVLSEEDCIYLIENAQEYILHTLPGKLDEVNNLIKSKAGNAKVIVLDYPRLFGETSFCISPYSEGIRTLMNGTANLMKGVISNATARAGANFVFRDVIPSFQGHAVCDGGTKWLNGVVTLKPYESYHPTIEGQSNGYYPVVHGVTG